MAEMTYTIIQAIAIDGIITNSGDGPIRIAINTMAKAKYVSKANAIIYYSRQKRHK